MVYIIVDVFSFVFLSCWKYVVFLLLDTASAAQSASRVNLAACGLNAATLSASAPALVALFFTAFSYVACELEITTLTVLSLQMLRFSGPLLNLAASLTGVACTT